MILTYKIKPEIVWLGSYLKNFCQNFGRKRNFGRNLDLIEFRQKFRLEREFRPNRNRDQKSSFWFWSSRNGNRNLFFGFGFVLSKIRFFCSLLWRRTTYDRKRPLTEDDLKRKTTLNGRQPLMGDYLWQKITFDEGQPLLENDLPSYLGQSPSPTENVHLRLNYELPSH